MNFFRQRVGILIIIVSVVSPFVATWLCAHQVIRLQTERIIQSLCFLGVLTGSIVYLFAAVSKLPKKILNMEFAELVAFISKSPKQILNVVFACLLPFTGFWVVNASLRHSDELFTYYKMSSISPQEWQQMASAIHQTAIKAAQRIPMDITRNQLPQVFDRLGRKDDLSGCMVNEWGDDVMVSVNYGGRQRRWGLVVAPQEYFDATANAKHTRISVATNACFYIHWGG